MQQAAQYAKSMVSGLAKICAHLCKHFIEKSHLAQKYLSKNIKQNKTKQKQTKTNKRILFCAK